LSKPLLIILPKHRVFRFELKVYLGPSSFLPHVFSRVSFLSMFMLGQCKAVCKINQLCSKLMRYGTCLNQPWKFCFEIELVFVVYFVLIFWLKTHLCWRKLWKQCGTQH